MTLQSQGVEGRPHGIRERTIRLPFNYPNTASVIKDELTKFLFSVKGSKQAEVFVTANVVFVNNDLNTYR